MCYYCRIKPLQPFRSKTYVAYSIVSISLVLSECSKNNEIRYEFASTRLKRKTALSCNKSCISLFLHGKKMHNLFKVGKNSIEQYPTLLLSLHRIFEPAQNITKEYFGGAAALSLRSMNYIRKSTLQSLRS